MSLPTFLLIAAHRRPLRRCSPFLLACLLLSGDIELTQDQSTLPYVPSISVPFFTHSIQLSCLISLSRIIRICSVLPKLGLKTPLITMNLHTVLHLTVLFKINERIKYKLLSLTYKVLTTNQPQYLHDLISVQPCHNTRSSSMVTLARPPTRFSLNIINRSFRYAAPCLWNELPTNLRDPRQRQSPSLSPITHGSSSSSPSPLSPLSSSLAQYFILNSRLGYSANPFLRRPFPFLPG